MTVAAVRREFVWDVDFAIADGCSADDPHVQAWRAANQFKRPSQLWPRSWPKDGAEPFVAEAKAAIARMLGTAADEVPGTPTFFVAPAPFSIVAGSCADGGARFGNRPRPRCSRTDGSGSPPGMSNRPSRARLERQLDYLGQQKCDIVSLQEVPLEACRFIESSRAFLVLVFAVSAAAAGR